MNPDMKRLHLSTLLVLVLIAGTWVTLNMRDYKSTVSAHEMEYVAAPGEPGRYVAGQLLTGEVPQRGFPAPMYVGHVGYTGFGGPPVLGRTFSYGVLLFNFLSGLFVMGLAAYVLESVAQKKKSPAEPSPASDATH